MRRRLATMGEITETFCRRMGLPVDHMTVRRRLDEMAIRRQQATLPPPQCKTEQYRDLDMAAVRSEYDPTIGRVYSSRK